MDIFGSIRVADLVDVALLAAFFFVGITWLRRSSSGSAARRITVLGFLLGSLYLLASAFDLYLVRELLEVLFFVFLIAAVVVFQSDIRRLLDRLASWSFGRGATVHAASPVEILVEAVANLAESRTGALIAIKGAEPWESHVHGGIRLDGLVSRPLLYSIFHSGTPGHDGAVLMEGDRITRFAAHLPLAVQLPAASRFGGTRHSAAKGLAEECDALVIVVSEERGTISVAHEGELVEMGSAAELGERLERFWREHYGGDGDARSAWWSRRALESAGTALGLAGLCWLLFSYNPDTVYRSFNLPVAIRNLPPGWSMESDSVPDAVVTLVGSDQAFAQLDPASLAISFDLDDPKPGENELAITEENLELPSGLRLYDANPPEVSVDLERRVALELPIRVRSSTPLPDSLRLVANPRTVRALVPAEMRSRPEFIPTEPVDPASLPPGGTQDVRLALPPEVHLGPDQRARVDVRLERRPAPASRPPAR